MFLNYSNHEHDPRTIKIIKKNLNGFSRISSERLLHEFEKLVKYAELELKEKELDVKEKISKSQVKMASDNNS